MVARELTVASWHEQCHEKLSEHTRKLPPLHVGDHVAVQNQHGNSPLKWDKRGVIVSVEPYDKYAVKILGSGRLTYRNRQHLLQYILHMLENNHKDESGAYFSDTCEKDGAQFSTETHCQLEVSHHKSTFQTVNMDPVNTYLEIQD